MFERENAFYEVHQAEFREKYPDKELVIAGESLFGVYDTPQEAIADALKHFKAGEFMMRSPANDGKRLRIGPGLWVKHAF